MIHSCDRPSAVHGSVQRLLGVLGAAALMLAMGGSVPVWAGTTPEYLGVYAVVDGKLIELKSHPQSHYRGIEVGAAALLRSLSGISLPYSEKLYFIVYRADALQQTKLFVEKIARVEFEVSNTGAAPVSEAWMPTGMGYSLRIAALPENPAMMIRAVPQATLAPGYWGLGVGGDLYDFVVGVNPAAECLVREVTTASLMSGEPVRYTKCDDFFSSNPRMRRPTPEGSGRGLSMRLAPQSSAIRSRSAQGLALRAYRFHVQAFASGLGRGTSFLRSPYLRSTQALDRLGRRSTATVGLLLK